MKLAVVLATLVSITGCSNEIDAMLDRGASFKTRICACPDMACASKVNEEMEAYLASVREELNSAKLTEAQTKRSMMLSKDIRDCRERLAGTNAGAAAK